MLKNLPFVTLLFIFWINGSAQFVRTHSLCYSGGDAYSDSIAYYYTGLQQDSLVNFHSDDGTNLEIFYKELLVYDVNGFVSLRTFIEYVDGVPAYTSQLVITNDAEGHALQSTMQVLQDGEWVNNYQTLYTYDGNWIVTEELSQYWMGAAWDDGSMVEYLNGADGHVSAATSYFYDGAWYEDGTRTYMYDNGLLVLVEYFDLNLEPYFKEEYTYNDADQLIAYVSYNWAFNAWFNNDSFYEYDINGNMTHEYWGHLEYIGGDSEYIDDGSCDHFYELIVVAVEESAEPLLLNVFPNPANEVLNVYVVTDNSWIVLHSADGKLAASERAMRGLLPLDISNLNSGIYYLSVMGEAGLQKVKVVVR